jgi:C4-dicarboxylate-specific signal transduction histidine kinase
MQAMERIVAETTRAAAIIRHIRHMVRKEESEERCVNLNDLTRRMIELLLPETVQHRIRVITEFANHVPAVSAVEVQIEQVILNLLRNAVDAIIAGGRGERTITVTTAAVGDREVEVVVADTGIGIRPDDMPRLFEPFFTTKPEGLGMGLRISRSIVEAHGGRLTASAICHGGASFTMRLPIAAVRA